MAMPGSSGPEMEESPLKELGHVKSRGTPLEPLVSNGLREGRRGTNALNSPNSLVSRKEECAPEPSAPLVSEHGDRSLVRRAKQADFLD
eukprot:3122070-Alexandrium_andersonii.AAC.1